MGIGIDGTGSDPTSYITFKQIWHKNLTEIISWSVYKTLEKAGKSQIVTDKARNLFVEFADKVAKTLGVTNCFVCGGTNSGQQWPWEAVEARGDLFNNMSNSGNITKGRQLPEDLVITWALTTNLVGVTCYKRNITNGSLVGDLNCLGYWDVENNYTWYAPDNLTEPIYGHQKGL
uniref:Uncharacterized protein n=1 Tax=Micrurus paraensis TaxID=1970185 RepID=A0A2D4KW11_9SAUR